MVDLGQGEGVPGTQSGGETASEGTCKRTNPAHAVPGGGDVATDQTLEDETVGQLGLSGWCGGGAVAHDALHEAGDVSGVKAVEVVLELGATRRGDRALDDVAHCVEEQAGLGLGDALVSQGQHERGGALGGVGDVGAESHTPCPPTLRRVEEKVEGGELAPRRRDHKLNLIVEVRLDQSVDGIDESARLIPAQVAADGDDAVVVLVVESGHGVPSCLVDGRTPAGTRPQPSGI